jgi:hypothetical protein
MCIVYLNISSDMGRGYVRGRHFAQFFCGLIFLAILLKQPNLPCLKSIQAGEWIVTRVHDANPLHRIRDAGSRAGTVMFLDECKYTVRTGAYSRGGPHIPINDSDPAGLGNPVRPRTQGSSLDPHCFVRCRVPAVKNTCGKIHTAQVA